MRNVSSRNTIADWACTILLLLFGATTLWQAFVIPTGSMEDSLRVVDHVLVDNWLTRPQVRSAGIHCPTSIQSTARS